MNISATRKMCTAGLCGKPSQSDDLLSLRGEGLFDTLCDYFYSLAFLPFFFIYIFLGFSVKDKLIL